MINFSAYLLIRSAGTILTLMPLQFSYAFARLLGNFTCHVLRYRRKVVMDNLRTAFGSELTPAELERIGAESYRQTAMTFIELLIAPKLRKNVTEMLDQNDFSLVSRLLRQGNGLVTVSGHLGNWELAVAESRPRQTANRRS